MSALSDRARSTQVRTDFAELVKLYIRFCEASKGIERGKDTYLVIAIDDIDLNLENGYDILEQIHRYLMVPGLIVLIAINYEDMSMLCQKRFVESYKDLEGRTIDDLGKRVGRMSENYLEKVLPIYMRLYMPSLKKTDFDLNDERYLKMDNMELPIKNAMFYLICKKTGVFYDACGQKRHFWEPETLRNLNGFYSMYMQMEDLPKEAGETYDEIYEKNYYKVIDDIIFRYAYEYLPYKEYTHFIKWSEEKIIRRGQVIIAEVKEKYQEKYTNGIGGKEVDISLSTKFEGSFKAYSYGGLLRALYHISQLELYDKKLVHLLLAQYTVVFSRIFKEYKGEIGVKETEKCQAGEKCAEDKYPNRDILKELIGMSVAKEWGNTNSRQLEENEKLTLFTDTQGGNKFPEWRKLQNCEKKNWAACKEYLLSKELDAVKVAILALLVCTPDNFSFEIINDKSGEVDFSLNLDDKSKFEFNQLSFIENSFYYEKNLDWINRLMIKALQKLGFLETTGPIEAWVKELNGAELDTDDSLRNKYHKWYLKYGGLALPIYNFDITYNLFKRLERDFEATESNYYRKLKEMYLYIQEKLGDQDKFYNEEILGNGKKDESNFHSNLTNAFLECPVIDIILKSDDSKHEEMIQIFVGEKSIDITPSKLSPVSNQPSDDRMSNGDEKESSAGKREKELMRD